MTSHLTQEFENWDQGFIKKTCTQICPFGRLKNTQNQFTYKLEMRLGYGISHKV